MLLLLGGREIIFRTTGLLTGELVSLVSYTTQAVIVSDDALVAHYVLCPARMPPCVRINEVL